jgi:PEP-CTERM motif-containing protein
MLRIAARVVTGVSLSVVLMSRIAGAAPVTFNFTGTVTQVPIDDIGTGVNPLDAIVGSFTFDSGAADAIPLPTSGSYTSTGAPFGMTATIGGVTFSEFGVLNVGILNSFVDQYTVHASSSPSLVMDFIFQDNTATTFSNDALPLSPPPLAAFLQRDFHLDELDLAGNETQIDGVISSLTCPDCRAVPAVPEPSSLVLLATGAMFYGRRRLNRGDASKNWRR